MCNPPRPLSELPQFPHLRVWRAGFAGSNENPNMRIGRILPSSPTREIPRNPTTKLRDGGRHFKLGPVDLLAQFGHRAKGAPFYKGRGRISPRPLYYLQQFPHLRACDAGVSSPNATISQISHRSAVTVSPDCRNSPKSGLEIALGKNDTENWRPLIFSTKLGR